MVTLCTDVRTKYCSCVASCVTLTISMVCANSTKDVDKIFQVCSIFPNSDHYFFLFHEPQSHTNNVPRRTLQSTKRSTGKFYPVETCNILTIWWWLRKKVSSVSTSMTMSITAPKSDSKCKTLGNTSIPNDSLKAKQDNHHKSPPQSNPKYGPSKLDSMPESLMLDLDNIITKS